MDKNTENFAEVNVAMDDIVDGYEEYKKSNNSYPAVKNILILNLSTFPDNKELKEWTYIYKPNSRVQKEGKYFYQQEPFPLRLKDKLKDSAEILMLTTPETLAKEHIKIIKNDKTESKYVSAQEYFIDSVKKISELKHTLFKSVKVNLEDPISAVSEVVEHLRKIKQNNQTHNLSKDDFTVYLGTNGGFRSVQLILEAILSLLKADDITVNPENVWGMRHKKGEPWEIFNSAEEFKIFDFVSAMSEFFNSGRITSLEKFKEAFDDDYSNKLLVLLRKISEGILFCSIKNFKDGLKGLRKLSHQPSNHYIEMFRNNIIHNFKTKSGADLLSADHDTLDEIKWCMEKGFYQQAFTLCEGALPKDFINKGIIKYDSDTKKAATALKNDDEDEELYMFNNFIMYHVPKKIKNVTEIKDGNQRTNEGIINMSFKTTNAHYLKPLLQHHRYIKNTRNLLNHNDTNSNESTENYLKTLTSYIQQVESFYSKWDKINLTKRSEPLLMLEKYKK